MPNDRSTAETESQRERFGVHLERQSDRQGRLFAEAIANSIRDGLLVLRPDLRVEAANTAFYRTFRVSPNQTEGRLVYDLGNGQWDIPRLRELLERILPERETIENFEVTHEFEGLGRRTMQLKAQRLQDGDLILVILEDVTEQRRSLEARESSEEQYRTLFNAIDDGFCVVQVLFDDSGQATDYRFVEANPAFEAQTGLSGALGRRMRELAPDLEEHWFEAYGRVAASGQPLRFTAEAKSLRGGVWYDVHAFRVGEPEERKVGILFHDVTERRQAEEEIRTLNTELEKIVAKRTEQLMRANRELTAFNYSVSHDLRAPLRGMDGFAAALAEDYGERLDATGRRYLERVREAAKRMNLLIDDLLRLSRISRSDVQPSVVNLSAIAHEVVQGLRERDPEHRVDVCVEEGVIVRGDPGLLRIALENLLENAWKFTATEGRPRIEVRAHELGPDERAVLVRDNGAGFDPQYSDRLFTPFGRLHSDAQFNGSGIGLTMVQRIVHLHGGRVEAESSPGEGATFRLTLPTR